MRTVKILLSGLVQGIFFRAFIKEKADKLGIKGHVRNLEGGGMEIFLEGEDSKVEEMIKICEKGSPHSEVKKFDVEEIKHIGFEDFRIVRF